MYWRPTELKQKGDKLSVLRIRIALQHCSAALVYKPDCAAPGRASKASMWASTAGYNDFNTWSPNFSLELPAFHFNANLDSDKL